MNFEDTLEHFIQAIAHQQPKYSLFYSKQLRLDARTIHSVYDNTQIDKYIYYNHFEYELELLEHKHTTPLSH